MVVQYLLRLLKYDERQKKVTCRNKLVLSRLPIFQALVIVLSSPVPPPKEKQLRGALNSSNELRPNPSLIFFGGIAHMIANNPSYPTAA